MMRSRELRMQLFGIALSVLFFGGMTIGGLMFAHAAIESRAALWPNRIMLAFASFYFFGTALIFLLEAARDERRLRTWLRENGITTTT